MILIVIASLFIVQTFGDAILVEKLLVANQNNTVKQETGVNSSVITSYPWVVSIRIFKIHYCSGSIINERVVLTLASCIRTPVSNHFEVQVGSASDVYGSGDLHAIVYSVKHHDFRLEEHNLGIIKVWPAFTIGEKVRPVQLADSARVDASGTSARIVAVGWHLENKQNYAMIADELMATEVYITGNYNCPKIDSSKNMTGGLGRLCPTDSNSQLCQFNDGGPLMINNVQVGIVVGPRENCLEMIAGSYINVSVHHDWIDEKSRYWVYPVTQSSQS